MRSPEIEKIKPKMVIDYKEGEKKNRYISSKLYDTNESERSQAEKLPKVVYDNCKVNMPEKGYHRHRKSHTDKVKSKIKFLTNRHYQKSIFIPLLSSKLRISAKEG